MVNVCEFFFTAASALITETVTIAKEQLGTNDCRKLKNITIMHRRT